MSDTLGEIKWLCSLFPWKNYSATTILWGACMLAYCGLLNSALAVDPVQVFPAETWATKLPAEVGLDSEKLDQFAERVGGDGCIIRHGYLVKSWGDVTRRKDWASAAKPVLSTLLMLAVEEGSLASVDSQVGQVDWQLSAKDAPMTFRHLANMVSGYALAEAPGAAWGYNDYAIQLYAQSLEKIFQQPLDQAVRQRLQPLQFEDGEILGSRNGRGLTASSRDFARLGWLWLNRGRWREQPLIQQPIFDDCVRVGVPAQLPRAQQTTHDYLKLGTYGGGTNQTDSGPGVYGFNFWFNEKLSSGERVWPALPADTFQANGLWNRDTLTVIPSWKIVLAARGTHSGKFEPGLVSGEYNQNLLLIHQALLDHSSNSEPASVPRSRSE
jgi:CubicO group peptidase (beta-lactamase class C family)